MPDAPALHYEMRKLSRDLTLTVTFHETYEFRVRRWIAIRLVGLAAWVLGCGIEIVDELDEHPQKGSPMP